MSTPALAALLLRLYPQRFRRRFAREWLDVAEWHRRRLEGARLAGLRLAAVLLFDTLKALPAAYRDEVTAGRAGPHPQDGWRRDVRHATRALARNRAFTFAATLTVALAIGANTATFSVVNAVLFRPLPYRDAERLAVVWNEFPGSTMQHLPLSGPEVQILREEPDLFEQVEGIWATSATLVDAEEHADQVSAAVVTPDFFDLLGVTPQLGRSFVPGGAEGPVPAGVLISDELWRGRFGADPAVVGRPIQFNGQATDVIGVLPAGFTLYFTEDGGIPPRLDAYTALPWDLTLLPPGQHYLRVVGRLRPGVDQARASVGATSAADRAVATYAELQATGDRFTVHPLQQDAVRAARPALLALLVAVGLFLLLAAANVASLILARTMARARELAIRSSLGASRAGLAWLVVVESLMLTAGGALIGVWLGRVGATTLWRLRPGGLARMDAVPLDGRVLGFTLAVSMAAGVAFALISLLAVRSVDPALGVRTGGPVEGRGGRRLREWMTAGEVAVGVVLVVGSSLMIQSVSSLGRESIGFDPSSALTFKVPISMRRFGTDAERRRVAHEIERRVSALPGVTAAGATSHLPFATWANWGEAAPPEGTPDAERGAYFADLRAVTPAYLPAVGASLVSGRFFNEADDGDSEPVVILDQTMAARIFPGRDAVGLRVEPSRFFGGQFVATGATVVGVVRDLRDRSPAKPSEGQVFWPFGQSARWELTWFVRSSGDPAALSGDIERVVRAVDPELAPARIEPMDGYVRTATGLTRFLALVGSVFSVLALTMASIGLYGVVAFDTAQRTHELGMRVVLGASRREVLGGVLAHGLRIGVAGVVAGTAATLALARFMKGLVYGVSPSDPRTLAAVAVLLVLVAVMASLGPARRATRVDPMVALRDS